MPPTSERPVIAPPLSFAGPNTPLLSRSDIALSLDIPYAAADAIVQSNWGLDEIARMPSGLRLYDQSGVEDLARVFAQGYIRISDIQKALDDRDRRIAIHERNKKSDHKNAGNSRRDQQKPRKAA